MEWAAGWVADAGAAGAGVSGLTVVEVGADGKAVPMPRPITRMALFLSSGASAFQSSSVSGAGTVPKLVLSSSARAAMARLPRADAG